MKLSLLSSKKTLDRFALVLFVSLMFQGCAMQWGAKIQWSSKSQILMSEDSQVKLRSIQSRVYDTTDRAKILRVAVATMQDLFLISTCWMRSWGLYRAKNGSIMTVPGQTIQLIICMKRISCLFLTPTLEAGDRLIIEKT